MNYAPSTEISYISSTTNSLFDENNDSILHRHPDEFIHGCIIAQKLSKGDIARLNFIYGKSPKRENCTFKTTKKEHITQGFYECVTCWGHNSKLICCADCRHDCHAQHEVVYHPASKEMVFCDCGANDHELKCTILSTGDNPTQQNFKMCTSCTNTRGKDNLVCKPCTQRCHDGHELKMENNSEVGVCSCTLCALEVAKTKNKLNI